MGRWIMTAAVLAAGTVFGMMALSGCGRKPADMTPEDAAALFGTDYTVSSDITFGELQLTADLTRQGGQTAVVITSPEHLEGLSFDGSTVRYKDLEVTAALPAASLQTVLDDVLDQLGRPESLKVSRSEDGQTIVSGNANGNFSLIVSDGAPVLLKMPGEGLTAAFRDFTPSENG